MCGSLHYRDAETTLPATCHAVSSEVHRATSAKCACRNNHHTYQISLRVTFGCFLLWKWASRGLVSQPWTASNQMRRPNSGRFQKKPSAGASNNGRVDGASVCVCPRVLLWRWLGKHFHMSYHYSAIPHFRELFGCPSYVEPSKIWSKTYISLHVKYSSLLPDFNETQIFFVRF